MRRLAPRGRGWLLLAVAGLLLVMGMTMVRVMATDGGGDRQDRDDEIRATIDGVWGESGIAEADIWLGEWTRRTQDTGGCATSSLPEDDRWIAFRDSRVTGERYPQRTIFDGAAAYLEHEGFDVQRYLAPLSDALELRAHRDELTVIFDVSTNGAAFVEVVAGPCAPFIADEPPANLEPLP